MAISEDASKRERLVMLVIAFVGGGFIGALGIPPFSQLVEGANATKAYFEELTATRPTILIESPYEGEGLVKFVPEKSHPGITLIQGIWPDGPQIRLLNHKGEEIHRWETDFFAIWPDAEQSFPSSRVPKSQHHYYTQGMHPLANGSIIFNFGDLGAARIDACSSLLWRSDRPTHHSVTPTENEKFWIPGHISIHDTPREYFPDEYTADEIEELLDDNFKDYNNSALLVTSDGKVERELSILASVYNAGLENALYSSLNEVLVDPTHLNDIEVVTKELAEKIDGVEEGDLLISLREMNMLAIIDEISGRLLWKKQGPWVRQHDPDITPDGNIEIFNNRSKRISPNVDSSQLLLFDPATAEISILAPVGEDDKFYTHIMGTHELLENGNRLIAESVAGRVFEVTPQGEIVWDFRMPFDESHASLFSAAMRLPPDYFEPGALSCRS